MIESCDKLAIHGGIKTRPTPMPSRMTFDVEELKGIEQLFAEYRKLGRDFGYQDIYEKRFTEAFTKYMGIAGYCDAVCSGSSALFIAVASFQLPKKNEVMVSPFADPSDVNAIILNDLVPILVDSMINSYNSGIDQYMEKITDKTCAAIVIHSYGNPAPIDVISSALKSKGIKILEDGSRAHGASINGCKVGTFGDVSAFSAMYSKTLNMGGSGGIVFTKQEETYRLIRAYADRGKNFWADDYDTRNPANWLFPAHNFNTDEISCAIGIESLKKLDTVRRKRIEFLKTLQHKLSIASETCRIGDFSDNDSPFFQPIFVDRSRINVSKIEFALAVREEGIPLNPHYGYLVSDWLWAKPYFPLGLDCPNANMVRNNSFNLLFNENYGEKEASDIASAIGKVERFFKE